MRNFEKPDRKGRKMSQVISSMTDTKTPSQVSIRVVDSPRVDIIPNRRFFAPLEGVQVYAFLGFHSTFRISVNLDQPGMRSSVSLHRRTLLPNPRETVFIAY